MTAPCALLALDLGRLTGWATLYPGDAQPAVGVAELTDTNVHEIALTRALRRWLRGYLPALAWGGGLVAYERPVSYAHVTSWQRTTYMEHELLEACERWGVPSVAVGPSTLKKRATGSGRASKDEVRAATALRWPGLAEALADLPLDASDALAVLGWALDELALGASSGGEAGISLAAVLGRRAADVAL